MEDVPDVDEVSRLPLPPYYDWLESNLASIV
jgi:hypothetical protein